MRLHSLFLFYLTLWRPLGYSLVALGVAFEGDGMLFTSAFLTAEGFFDVGDMMIIIFLSVILGDTIWFLIGRNYIRRFPRLVRLVNKFAKPFDRHLGDASPSDHAARPQPQARFKRRRGPAVRPAGYARKARPGHRVADAGSKGDGEAA